MLAPIVLALLAAPAPDLGERLRAAELEHPARTDDLRRLAASLGRGDALQGGPPEAAPSPLRVDTVVELGTRRLLVTVADPSGLIDRVEVVHQRSRAGPETVATVPVREGRWSAPLPLGWPRSGQLSVELGSSLIPGGAVWRRAVPSPSVPPSLAPTAPAPGAPEPASVTGKPPPWAWVVLGAVTAALVGASVWQETR